MNQLDTRRHNAKVFGAVLIGLGILLLVGQLFSFEFLHWSFGQLPWPTFVIVPGVALLVLGLLMGRAGLPLTTIGTMATVTGLILAFQDYTGAFQTWAYAWALVVPGSVGLSMMLYGRVTYQGEFVHHGLNLGVIGLVLFGIGFAFFEFAINLSGFGSTTFGRFVGPVLLIGLGVYLLLRRSTGLAVDDSKVKNSASES